MTQSRFPSSHSRRFFLRLVVTSVGFLLMIGHGVPGCKDLGGCDCGPQCNSIDNESAYFDVEGCWFGGLELQYPPDTCRTRVTLHPDGQAFSAGWRSGGSDPRDEFAFRSGSFSGRLRCEATSSDGEGAATQIVCTDECPRPGEDLSCTGTLRLRDTPLGEPLGAAEIRECVDDGGLPDLTVDASPSPTPDAAMDADGGTDADAAVDADGGADADAAVDAGGGADADVEADAGADADVDAG